jgi:hypothetical protein
VVEEEWVISEKLDIKEELKLLIMLNKPRQQRKI